MADIQRLADMNSSPQTPKPLKTLLRVVDYDTLFFSNIDSKLQAIIRF